MGGANVRFAGGMSVGRGAYGGLVLLAALRSNLRSAYGEQGKSIRVCAYPGKAIRIIVVGGPPRPRRTEP